MPQSPLSEEKLKELQERMDAKPLLPWEGVGAYIEHAMSLVRPGGMMSVVLPDGRPFFARREPSPADKQPAGDAFIQGRPAAEVPTITCPRCHMRSTNPHDIAQGYCGNCHDWTSEPAGDAP